MKKDQLTTIIEGAMKDGVLNYDDIFNQVNEVFNGIITKKVEEIKSTGVSEEDKAQLITDLVSDLGFDSLDALKVRIDESDTNKYKETNLKLIKDMEKLTNDFTNLQNENNELKTINTNNTRLNTLTKMGIKSDMLDKATKLFDVEDLDNEEDVNNWVESTKKDFPQFFSDVKPDFGKTPDGQEPEKGGGLASLISIT